MIKVPAIPEKYDRAALQQLANAVAELQRVTLLPRRDIPILDSVTGEPQVIRADAGVVEAFDPT